MTPDQQTAVDRAIIAGDLVDAIRLYRTATGVDLATASSYVQKRSASLNESMSAPSAPSAPSDGWSAPSARSRGRAPAAADWSSVASTTGSTQAPTQLDAAIGSKVRVIVIVVIVVVVSSVLLGGLLPLIIVANVTHNIADQFSIAQEPYYNELAGRIKADPKFRGALGVPIAIDQGHIQCNAISDTPVMQQASCRIPVNGPKGVGSVHVQVQNRPGGLDAAMSLYFGDTVIRSNS